MAAFNFTTVDDRNFALNGRAYPSIYMARQFDNDPGFIEIVEKDNQLSHLVERERIGNISIDGKSDWSSAEELQVALNSQLKIGGFKSPGSGGGSGSGSASDVTVNQSGFETISGANVQAVLNSIDDILTEGGGGGEGYVPYQPDGKSVAALAGGALMVGNTDIATIVSGGDSSFTWLQDLESGIDVGMMVLKWNGDRPLPNASSGDTVRGTVRFSNFGAREEIGLAYVCTNNGISSTNVIVIQERERDSIGNITIISNTVVYFEGNVDDANAALGGSGIYGGNIITAETPTGWGPQTYTFPPDRISEIIESLDLRSTDTTWGVDLATIGFSEPERIQLGDGKSPVKIQHNQGERILEAEVDENGEIVAEHTIARTSDIPTNDEIVEIARGAVPIPEVSTKDVTAMFTFAPEVPNKKVWMRTSPFSDPEIVIEIENATNDQNDLIITPAFGFGALNDHVDNHAIQLLGKEQKDNGSGTMVWTSGVYDATITGETDQAQSQITVPWQIWNGTIKYTVGQTEAPKASYWIERISGIVNPFELANTPISGLGGSANEGFRLTINQISVAKLTIGEIVFGESYRNETELPFGFLNHCSNIRHCDISVFTNARRIQTWSFRDCNNLQLVCGDIDASVITVDANVFMDIVGSDSLRSRSHTTQDLADKWAAKFPTTANWNVIITG